MQPLALLFTLLAALPFAGLAQLTQQQLAALSALRRILMMQRILMMHRYASIESHVRLVDLVVRQRDVQLQNSVHLSVPINIPDNIPNIPQIRNEYFFNAFKLYLGKKKVSRHRRREPPNVSSDSNLGRRNRRTSRTTSTFTVQVVKATRAAKPSTWTEIGIWSPRGK